MTQFKLENKSEKEADLPEKKGVLDTPQGKLGNTSVGLHLTTMTFSNTFKI